MKSEVYFAEPKIKEEFQRLKDSHLEEKNLYQWIKRAIADLEADAFCGIQIPKKQIPKEYTKKYNIDNLWKYNLPNAWRLLYSVTKGEVMVVSIILEWMDHTQYERKFKY
ncbi:MAG: hypothetical protein NTW48_08940 [Chloroflexi bacterium]|nr:hypothetical protein [Chloroflexota bacterium]